MSQQLPVVILAGGLGTRLRSVAPDLPKALVPVAGRPFIEHQFALLRSQGVCDVILCIGMKGDVIERHVGDGSAFGMSVRYSREDPTKLLGTGGALVNAWPVLPREFFVMYGDSYLPTNFRAVADAFRIRQPPALMCVYRNEGRWDNSNTRMADGWVTFYSKRAQPGEADYIDYGLSVYQRDTLEPYRTWPMPLDLATVQEDLVRQKKLAAFEVFERFYEIGKPEGLRELDALLRGDGKGTK